MLAIILCLFRFVRLLGSGHRAVAVENLALRLQLAAFTRKRKRPALTQLDRLFWVGLSQVWSRWRDALVFVQPDTVVRWQRERFRRYWARLSRCNRDRRGRPRIPAEIRRLILRMATANPLWRAPRIHGELKMLGIMISERTVSRILKSVRRPPPSPTWKTFLRNNLGQIVSVGFFTVPGLTFAFPQQLEIVVENPEVLVPILSQNLVRTFIPGQVHERDGITASQMPGSGPKRSVIAGKVWYTI